MSHLDLHAWSIAHKYCICPLQQFANKSYNRRVNTSETIRNQTVVFGVLQNTPSATDYEHNPEIEILVSCIRIEAIARDESRDPK